MPAMTPDQRLDKLETMVALQDDLLEKLDYAYGEQQLQLHRLSEEVVRLRKQLMSMEPSKIRSAAEEEPPPHY